jgi:tail tape-measure protein
MANMEIRIDAEHKTEGDAGRVVGAQQKIIRKTQALIDKTIALGQTNKMVYQQMEAAKRKFAASQDLKAQQTKDRSLTEGMKKQDILVRSSEKATIAHLNQSNAKKKLEAATKSLANAMEKATTKQKDERIEYIRSGKALKDHINKVFKEADARRKSTRSIKSNTTALKGFDATVKKVVATERDLVAGENKITKAFAKHGHEVKDLTGSIKKYEIAAKKLDKTKQKLYQTSFKQKQMTQAQEKAYSKLAVKAAFYRRAVKSLTYALADQNAAAMTSRSFVPVSSQRKDGTAYKVGDQLTTDPSPIMPPSKIDKSRKSMKKFTDETAKAGKRTSILNTRMGNFFVIMTGIAGTMFVFQKISQWMRDFINFGIEGEKAIIGLNRELSLTPAAFKGMSDAAGQASRSGFMKIGEATEKIKEYIKAGLSARDATMKFYQDMGTHHSDFADTATGALEDVIGKLNQLNEVVFDKLKWTLMDLSKFLDDQFGREAIFKNKEADIISDINLKKQLEHIDSQPGVDIAIKALMKMTTPAYKDAANINKSISELEQKLLDLRNANFLKTAQDKSPYTGDHWDVGKPRADAAYWEKKGKDRKHWGIEWKKISQNQVQYYGMSEKEMAMDKLKTMRNQFLKIFKEDSTKLFEVYRWYTVESGRIEAKHFEVQKYTPGHEERMGKEVGRSKMFSDFDKGMAKFHKRGEKDVAQDLRDMKTVGRALKKVYDESKIMSDDYYNFSKGNLDKEHAYLKGILGDSLTLRKWYDKKLITLDLNRLKSSNKVSDGMKAGFIRYAESIAPYAYGMAEAWNKSIKSMEDSFVNFVITGKFEFEDLINSILADISRLVIRQQIMGPLSEYMGGLDLGGLFGGGSSGAVDASNWSSVVNLGGKRAAGGPVDPNKAYIVGEEGPELLQMGSSSGNVIPNNQLGGAPPVTVVVYNNTGEKANVRQEKPKFNGSEWVIGVWLDAYGRNAHGLRDALGN